MPSKKLNLRIEPELDRALRVQADAAGVGLSVLVRSLLRQTAGVTDPFTSGWREGYAQAYSEARKAHDDTHHDLGSAPRGPKRPKSG